MKNLRSNQHIVLFSSLKTSPTKHQPTTMEKLLGSCLRSTCQIARFANSYIENGPKNIIPAFPSNNLEGEIVDISFVKDDASTYDIFVAKCYDAIRENVEKIMGADHVLVVPFMETDVLEKLIKRLEYGNISFYCHLEGLLGPEHQKQTTSSHFKPDVFLCDPFKIEGCEFPIVLILIDAKDLETFKFNLDGNKFTTAITRASLKVKIIVNHFKNVDDERVDTVLKKVHDKKIQKFVDENGNKTTGKTTVLIVGKKPQNLHLWKKNLNEESIPNVDNISLYVGNQGSFLHLDDIYLESDFLKLQQFGVQKILLTNENVSSFWHYFYVYASALCISNFCYSNPKSFALAAHLYNPKLMKYQVNLHLNFLQYQSGDYSVKIPSFWLDFETEPIPKLHGDNWKTWKSKAEELMRFGAATPAVHLYECCIKLLKQRLISNDETEDSKLVVDELVSLSTTASRIYLEHTNDIVEGSKFGYDFRELVEQDCFIKAYRNVFSAIRWKPLSQEGYGITTKIMEKIKEFAETSAHSTEIAKRTNEDKLRKNIYTFRQAPLCPFTENHPDFEHQMNELDHLVSDYDANRFEKRKSINALIALRKDISRLTRSASEAAFGKILEQYVLDTPAKESFQVQFTATTQIFDYSVQLGLEALYWDPSDPKCKQILLSALEHFELSCERLKISSSFV